MWLEVVYGKVKSKEESKTYTLGKMAASLIKVLGIDGEIDLNSLWWTNNK